MITFLINAILFLLGAILIVYLLYFIMVLNTSKKHEYLDKIRKIVNSPTNSQKLPSVSVLVPTYNEEETIYNKLKNISEFNYPKEKIEVLILDDCSLDNTQRMVKKGFEDFAVNGKILKNKTRMGVNALYNKAMAKAKFEYILTTDADAKIPEDTLKMVVKILMQLKEVGGIAVKMIPVSSENTMATKIESAYRGFMDSMLVAESAIFSTFPGSTSCALIRKSVFSSIPSHYGSSDGNISLSIIKKGFRFIYVPNVIYYEPISRRINEQRRQKIRRATRLIQSILLNLDILFAQKCNKFGRIIFPLRLLMSTVCPIFILSSIFMIFAFTYLVSFFLFSILLTCATFFVLLGTKTNIKPLNSIITILMHQIYLCIGFFLSYRKMNVWKRIERNSGHTNACTGV